MFKFLLIISIAMSSVASVQSIAETPPPSTTAAAPPVSNASSSCVTAFKSKFPIVPSSFEITSSTFPVSATILISGNTYKSQQIWIANINDAVTSSSVYTSPNMYTYEEVIAYPSLAPSIVQPARLNQVAYLLNNIVAGTSVATPNSQIWWATKYTGCTTISASDIQAVFWALTQAKGKCDMNPAYSTRSLCSNGQTSPKLCNVAYLWNLAFSNVADGATYSVPSTFTSQPVTYPIVVVPASSTQAELIVAVNINSWGISPQCLNNTCVSAFKQGFPTDSPYFEITTPVQSLAYVDATVEIAGITHTNQATFCVDYTQSVYSGTVYTDSPVYAYEYVVANPSAVTNIDRPQHLNQVAYLVNNAFVETTVAPNPQVWWGVTYTGCTTISASDFQAAIWALVQSAGECDMQPTPANDYKGTLCTSTISTPNTCNVAFLWNLAFAGVPDGANYSVSVSYSPYPVVYPLVVSPTVAPVTQVQIVAVAVNSWGGQCCVPWAAGSQCCAVGGYYYPQGSSVALPCRAGYYCPNASTPAHIAAPVKCPAGYYCPTASCTPIPCPCGSKCPAGSSAPITCQPPYYCPAGAKSQTLCPLGSMCPNPGMCSPTPCPLGTFVSCAGKVSCSVCPAGRYCPSVTNQSLLCPAGYYCPAGSSAKTICPKGHYCHVGASAATACPQGSYLNTTGAAYHSACLQCPAGKYENATGASACALCPAGTYQDKTNSTACKACAGARAGSTTCAGNRRLLEGGAESAAATAGGDRAEEAKIVLAAAADDSLEARARLELQGVTGEDAARELPASRLPATGAAALYALLTMALMVGTALTVRRLLS